MTSLERSHAAHQAAMDLAEDAFLAERRGERATAVELYRRAFLLESEAAETLADSTEIEPTRSILYRSAATLALRCGELRAAERLASTGLAGKPPREIEDELRTVLDEVVKAIYSPASRGPEYRALTLLTRLAKRRPDAEKWLEAVLHGRLEQLAGIVLEVAVETGDPIGMALAREVDATGTQDLLLWLVARCGEDRFSSSLHLREVGLTVTRKVRQLAIQESPQLTKSLQIAMASTANNLGIWLSSLGRHEEALQATQEAVVLYRRLAESRPDDFLPSLATSLNNLGCGLSGLSRFGEALQATQEAVDLYRQLAENHPGAFIKDLAMSLDNLAWIPTLVH